MTKRAIDTETGEIDSDSLCTPPDIAVPLLELWDGPADTDPCSNEHSIVQARVRHFFAGLHVRWHGLTYQNHPYSTNEPWIAKACLEMATERVTELLILCMTAASTAWWSQAMNEPKRNPRVMCTKRLKFLGPGGVPLASGARFDTSLIYYGPRVRQFDRLFKHVARWTTWGR